MERRTLVATVAVLIVTVPVAIRVREDGIMRRLSDDEYCMERIREAYPGFSQIEGHATLHGHPLKPENSDYIDAYKRKLPVSYEKVEKPTFEQTEKIEVIKISPSKISIPTFSNTFSLDVLDIQKNIAWRTSGGDWAEAPAYRE